ncbi:Mss4-like protein, partial [Protomyces lactucae-debilis]
IEGGCFCGRVRYRAESVHMLLSAYCHCTNCQRLTAGTAVHSIHIEGDGKFDLLRPALAIDGKIQEFHLFSNTNKFRKRCVFCGTQFASWNADKKKWSIWASTVDRDSSGQIPEWLRAQHHMFYGTRRFSAFDELPKWIGYPEISERV